MPHPGVGGGSLKSGFVAVAGRPNVGKSTLVNALGGGKVAIVSDKPQTTRRRIFGIANGRRTTSSCSPTCRASSARAIALTERMQRTVDRSLEDVDAVLLVLSAPRADRRRRPLHRRARLRPRRAGRDRAEQGRPAQAGPHRRADGTAPRGSATSTRSTRSARDRRRRRRAARRARRAAAGRARVLPARPAHRPPARGADRRARAREGARS